MVRLVHFNILALHLIQKRQDLRIFPAILIVNFTLSHIENAARYASMVTIEVKQEIEIAYAISNGTLTLHF